MQILLAIILVVSKGTLKNLVNLRLCLRLVIERHNSSIKVLIIRGSHFTRHSICLGVWDTQYDHGGKVWCSHLRVFLLTRSFEGTKNKLLRITH